MNVNLRAPEPADLDALYIWENDAIIRQYGSATAPYSRALLWNYINNYDADPYHAGQLRMMIDVDGETVGSIDLYNIDGKNLRAFVGIMIDEKHRGKGIGKAALDSLADYCATALGLHQLLSVIPVPNVLSIELFETAGYQERSELSQWVRIGKQFVDAKLMGKFL